MRIAVAGWQHETNTFSPIATELRHFYQADSWPGLSLGEEILTQFKRQNIPVVGFMDSAQNLGHQIVPLLWCSANTIRKSNTIRF